MRPDLAHDEMRYTGSMATADFHVTWRWLIMVLRGVVAILAGIAGFVISPDAAKALLVAYFLADGLLTLLFGARLQVAGRSRLLIIADGFLDLVVALLLVTRAPSVPLLIMIVSLWAIATGILESLAAVFIPRFSALSWAVALVGAITCALGIVMIDWNNLAEIGLLYFFATYAVIAGVLFVAFGIALARAVGQARTARPHDIPEA